MAKRIGAAPLTNAQKQQRWRNRQREKKGMVTQPVVDLSPLLQRDRNHDDASTDANSTVTMIEKQKTIA
jgi:hypothetical protein